MSGVVLFRTPGVWLSSRFIRYLLSEMWVWK